MWNQNCGPLRYVPYTLPVVTSVVDAPYETIQRNTFLHPLLTPELLKKIFLPIYGYGHSEDIHLNLIGSQRYHCNGMLWKYCTLMQLKIQDNVIHWYRNQFSYSRNRCVGMNAWTNRNFILCVLYKVWSQLKRAIFHHFPDGASPPPTSLYWYLPCASIIISFSVGNSACFQKIKWRWCF